MAKDINKYAQNIARARYQTQGGTHSVPVSGRTGATIDIAGMSGKTAAKGAAPGATLASRPIEGGPALPSPKEFNPIIDAESGEDPNTPRVETQQPIENRGIDPRYMIQGGGPRIDLSGFFPERTNKSFDSSKAIGGENVPYQASGFFRGLMGDPANRKNIEAQQAQGAEWRQDAKEQKIEDRALNRMREGDKPTQARFEATQASNLASENTRNALTKEQMQDLRDDRIARLNNEVADRAARVAEWENSRLFSAGEGAKGRTFQAGQAEADRGFRSSEGDKSRTFQAGEGQAERAARSSEGESNRALTAAHYNLVREDNAADRGLRANEGAANRALTAAHQNLVSEDNAANRTLRANEGAAGRAIDEARLGLQRDGQAGDQAYRAGEAQYRRRADVERLGENLYKNEKGEVFEFAPGKMDFKTGKSAPGGFNKIPTQAIPKTVKGAGGQVDRTTGLLPGDGVRMGGALPPLQAAVVTQPRSATLADKLVNLPGMGAALDMSHYMTPERVARLEESKRQQQAESLKRTRAMQEQAYGDLGPSAF